jgi:hypothetical protein
VAGTEWKPYQGVLSPYLPKIWETPRLKALLDFCLNLDKLVHSDAPPVFSDTAIFVQDSPSLLFRPDSTEGSE